MSTTCRSRAPGSIRKLSSCRSQLVNCVQLACAEKGKSSDTTALIAFPDSQLHEIVDSIA